MFKRFFPVLVVAAFALGCNDPTGPNDAVAGTYILRTINQTVLPVSFNVNHDSTFVMLGDTLLLNKDGTYRNGCAYQIIKAGSATRIASSAITGTYTNRFLSVDAPGTRVVILNPDNADADRIIFHSIAGIESQIGVDSYLYIR